MFYGVEQKALDRSHPVDIHQGNLVFSEETLCLKVTLQSLIAGGSLRLYLILKVFIVEQFVKFSPVFRAIAKMLIGLL